MTAKVIISFAKLRDDELHTRAHSIIEKMTNNPNFLTPFPAIADVATAYEAYSEALEQGQNGGKDKTVVKNARRKTLEELLRALGLYIQVHCKNDVSIVLGAGFDACKAPTPKEMVPLGRPVNFTLENGAYPGSMIVSVDKIPGAGSYQFEYAAMPVTEASQWTRASLTARIYTFDGLTSGQLYAFRVTGVGIDVTPVYSDVITRYPQ